MASLFELFVKISGDNSSFKKSVQDSQAQLGQFEATTEASATRMSAIGAKLMGAIGFGAIGAGALAAASKFEEANVQIQRSTGATGEKLANLEKSFTSVYKQTAASSESVTTVLSLLSTRTQATGKDLEDLTLKTIKLAKTQKEDVAAIVPLVTRAFGDWSLSTDKQGKAMDYLRVTSQQTGASVSKLAEEVVYAGAPLRALGYSFEQAASLIGKFDKEGVNTELVLGGMKAALGKFQKEGITDTAQAWADFVAGVKSGTISMGEVVTLVGVKRATDLSRAIMEGRFEIDKMVESSAKLASESAPNVETLKTSFTKLQHQAESLVVAHKDLILILGTTFPVWAGFASAGGSAIGALITRLIGAGGATAAVATLSSSTFLLGGTFTTAGATIAAAGATATAGWAALLPVLAAAAIAAGGVLYISANLGKYQKPMYSTAPPAGTAITGNEPWAKNISAALSPPTASAAPAAAVNPASGGVPADLHFADLSQMVSAKALDDIDAGFRKMVGTMADWSLNGRKVATVSSEISTTLDVVANTNIPSVAQGVEVTAKTFDQSLNPAILQSEALMHALGLTSTRELRAQYDAAMRSTEAMILSGASEADVEAAATATAVAHKKLSERMGEWDGQAKTATKTGVDFGRQVSTAVNDLGKSLASVVMGEKAIGDAFKDVGKTIVRIILEDIIANAIGKLMKELAKLATSMGGVGRALGGLLGVGTSAAGSAAGGVASGVGGAASTGGGVASAVGGVAGAMNIVGAVSAAVGAVSSIIGNFQMAGMNKTLDLIENYTRYLKIGLVEQGDSLLNDSHIIRNSLTELMKFNWGVLATYLQGMSINLDTIAGKGGTSGKGGISFSNCNFTGTPQQNMDAAFAAAQLAGALG